MTTQVSVREARANLADLLCRAADYHERFVVTTNGKPTALLMGINDFESLMETLDVLSNPETMAGIAEGERDIAEGRTLTVTPGMTLQELRALPEPE